MSTTPLRLAVIVGSVREGRFGPVVASWIAAQAARHDRFEIDVIDLAEAEIPLALPAVPPALEPNPQRPAGMLDLTERLAAADAFIV
ncbi:MAG: NADPH-dependent oxidoreductase, partial [Nocardia sp.]|nr:NADPH-dependent oxidoreductase [Nocardia sp.]